MSWNFLSIACDVDLSSQISRCIGLTWMGSRSGRSEGAAPEEVPWKLLQAGLRTKMTESEITLSPSCACSAAQKLDR